MWWIVVTMATTWSVWAPDPPAVPFLLGPFHSQSACQASLRAALDEVQFSRFNVVGQEGWHVEAGFCTERDGGSSP